MAAVRKKVSLDDYFARVADLTQATGNIAGAAVQELAALPRPSDNRVASYIALSEREASLVKAEARALRGHDRQSVHRLDTQIRDLGRRTHTLAHAYGFHECGGT